MYCLYYKDELTLNIVENLCERSYCEYSNKFFSDGKFSYKREEKHQKNYLELLQIVIFYAIRINDELEFYKSKLANI